MYRSSINSQIKVPFFSHTSLELTEKVVRQTNSVTITRVSLSEEPQQLIHKALAQISRPSRPKGLRILL